MGIDHKLSFEYSVLLNQTQIQSLELLVLNNTELQSVLENEYLENPMFEYTGSKGRIVREETYSEIMEIPVYDRQEAKALVEDQLNMKRYTGVEQRIIRALVACLDSRGYFTESVYDVAKILRVSEEQVGKCLNDLKKLEPAGIFASGLEECLRLQVERLGIQDEVLDKIICDYLEDISKGKISSITRALNISSVQARKYIEFIRKLNPLPLSGMEMSENEYIIPDIICRREGGVWDVRMNDDWIGNYEISDYYVKMYRKAKDDELKMYFKQKYDRARFIVNSIEQRRRTVLRVAEKILECQSEYFINRGELKPLRMEDVAELLGIHVSTVSRAVKGKYLEYSGGVVALKDMFAAGVGAGEGVVTVARIKSRIAELINCEEKAAPLSDQRISEALKKESIQVSRRGVAKYRQEIGIPSSVERLEKE